MFKSVIFMFIINLIHLLSIVNGQEKSDCKTYHLCETSEGYNEQQLKEIVSNEKYQKFLPLFGNVVDKPNVTITIESRFGDKSKGNMCATKRITMFPKKGLTLNSQEKKIVNVPGYHQMVTFEACHDGAECYVGKDYVPLGVSSFCETQFIIVRLVVVNDDNTLGLEQFSIPSGCSCMYLVNS
ncbi:protein spaetzle-like [Onthophagus taurus]|uniref:protein spaetzle-like n=1 Tax=Onthophagus taurus TaxID=166361 RepID=UPI000C20C65B|nr:uncharacterized protein LOC111421992 [Onthophagus taurus]